MAVGKSKKTGSRSMIECRTCKMWVDLDSCKGLTEMSQSERNKFMFGCWKCILDERVKMADVNMKKEEEIKRLKAEVVFLKRELENGRKLKGGEDVRNKRRVGGDVNDSVKEMNIIVNEKMNGPWAKGNGRRMIEKNGVDENEQNRINEKMHGPWIKVGGRRINEMDVMKGEYDRERRMQGRVRPVIRICGDSMVRNVDRYVRMGGSSGCTSLRGKRVKEICEYAEKVIDDMNEGMVIVQAGGNGLLENGREATVNAIMKVVERKRKKNVRVAVTSLLKRPACNEEYERLRKEVNRDLHEKILAMKAEVGDGCFLEDGVHLSQEGETKLPQRFIRWIRATHLHMEGRMD
ncbi:SGNH hydrolase-type esterase domain [Trinorchestia longiramus]|nr:SGNH hydrolase-type esterase domain [Trinorchestia longiramus]